MLKLQKIFHISFLTAVKAISVIAPLSQRTDLTFNAQNITFDNPNSVGQLPAGLAPVNVPFDSENKSQIIEFRSFAYNNAAGDLSYVEPQSSPIVAATTLRIVITNALLGLIKSDARPEKDLQSQMTIDYDGSPASSFDLEELYLATGLASVTSLVAITATVEFTAVPATDDRKQIVEKVVFTPNSTREGKQDMMRVKFPDSFRDLKSVKVAVTQGVVALSGSEKLERKLNGALIAVLLDNVLFKNIKSKG